MALNIKNDTIDAFYRYKMPRLETKIESRGNGVKTVIGNVVEVAKSLDRPPGHLMKFFSYELGAQTQLKNGRHIINGQHSRLQETLQRFIQQYVLCSVCENPETILSARGGKLKQKCGACGRVSSLDPSHKFSNYLLKDCKY